MVVVTCSACESIYSMGMFSPDGVRARNDEEVLAAFERRIRHDISMAIDGVCTVCDGALERTLLLKGTGIDGDRDVVVTTVDDGTDHGHSALYRCVQCDFWAVVAIGTHRRTHPVVVGLYWDHGVDLRTVPDWDLEWCLPFAGVPCTTLVSEDPVVFEVAVQLNDERLRTTVDDDLVSSRSSANRRRTRRPPRPTERDREFR